jgi:hypothetical protein
MAAHALPACQNGTRDPDTWYSTRLDEQAEARAVCFACPLRPACQAAVLGFERGWPAMDRHGIWAGLDGNERTALDPTATARPARLLTECGTEAAYTRHKRRGEPIDEACQAAFTEAGRRRRYQREARSKQAAA